MSGSIRFIGGDAVRARLTGVAAAASGAIAKALFQEGETIIAESKDRVPVDTGALKNSGFVDEPETSAATVSVTVGFGGAAAEYAIYVHEDLEARHEVGGPKFLESVLNEHEAGFADRIGASIKQELGT